MAKAVCVLLYGFYRDYACRELEYPLDKESDLLSQWENNWRVGLRRTGFPVNGDWATASSVFCEHLLGFVSKFDKRLRTII